MGRPLLRILIFRGALVALPFVVWFVWRAWARRTGREMGATPYAWLFAAGALLLGISLIGTALFHKDNQGARYVPGEVIAGGAVSKGHFEPRAPK
jgi:DMSO/TMAO reductase YedYZ heme-binding membrane subunit